MSAPGTITAVEAIAFTFFCVFAAGYGALLVQAARTYRAELRRAARRRWSVDELAASPSQPLVTIVVPAHQEQDSIVPSVRALLDQRWSRLEVIVVPNGCTDATVDRLRSCWDLRPTGEPMHRSPAARGRIDSCWRSHADPRLRVIETSGAGKSDAVNCALERAAGEYCLLVDADSLLAPHAVARAVLPFVEDGAGLVATSAGIRVLNGAHFAEGPHGLPRNPLALVQVIEYARAFRIGRAGWASIGALPVVSGAFGLFRTDVLRAVGGLDVTTVGEDMELILRLHATVRHAGRRGRIEFISEPLCWTEVPEDIASLRAQRIRWHRGLVECARRHGSMFFAPRHGTVGMLSFPFLGLFEMLAPLVELLGIMALVVAAAGGAVSWAVVWSMALMAIGFGLALSMGAVLLEQMQHPRLLSSARDVWVLFGAALLEQFGHRQRTAAWRMRGLVAGVRGGRASWGTMHHRGAAQVADP